MFLINIFLFSSVRSKRKEGKTFKDSNVARKKNPLGIPYLDDKFVI
jgi:hypothetical protein